MDGRNPALPIPLISVGSTLSSSARDGRSVPTFQLKSLKSMRVTVSSTEENVPAAFSHPRPKKDSYRTFDTIRSPARSYPIGSNVVPPSRDSVSMWGAYTTRHLPSARGAYDAADPGAGVGFSAHSRRTRASSSVAGAAVAPPARSAARSASRRLRSGTAAGASVAAAARRTCVEEQVATARPAAVNHCRLDVATALRGVPAGWCSADGNGNKLKSTSRNSEFRGT
mmetsp:Transcript_1420/g.3063  ORF Transcript_1420/g.3063 Transcript_1420/m.3063 type:complete len:226 (-) Transcript_1420:7-684(-)